MQSSTVALITGGEGSLAQGLQATFLDRGWRVNAPGRAELNVHDAAQVKHYFAHLERIDLLVCNAAHLADGPVIRMDADTFDDVLSSGLRGAFLTVREALKKMVRQKSGHVVLLGSVSGVQGRAGQANYAAAKAGLLGLASSLAAEYGGRNIRVNTILPGFLETSMTQHMTPEIKEELRAEHALRRFNTVEQVARFISFLHEEMPHTSGQIFNLDSRILRWT